MPAVGGAAKATKFPVPVAPSVLSVGMVKSGSADTASTVPEFIDPSSIGPISYETLKGAFPPNINPAIKEEYMSEEEFLVLFKVTKVYYICQL